MSQYKSNAHKNGCEKKTSTPIAKEPNLVVEGKKIKWLGLHLAMVKV